MSNRNCGAFPSLVYFIVLGITNINTQSSVFGFSGPSLMSFRKSSHVLFSNKAKSEKRKRIVLIRHGCTYMNEHLAKPGCGWGDPDFTDIFVEDEGPSRKYRDSPLSPRGESQARSLYNRWAYRRKNDLCNNIIDEMDLVVVSPLTRGLQTTELGLLPCWKNKKDRPPFIALPYASERLYLISDVGMPTSKLSKSFPWTDFDIGFPEVGHKETWWFSPNSAESSDELKYELKNFSNDIIRSRKYKEWRPFSQRQTYAHPGEPEDYFSNRMDKLIHWLDSREEQTIALVCHWGVIDWLIGEDFDNCEVKVVDFELDIMNRNLIRAKI